ncbi:diphthine--ammonia ligase [Chitinophaga pendula]|uniref:Dph6-related ATP pyrophosphatase n=1 Tax=Chitinophaga TaxID=79328 RepID=UPI000BB079A5|nr:MULTISPECIES: diphthine--ammonia ligase [Chitinophaga]ASZ09974.1 ATP-binding protein [Chitinophaga sp. MD30]UCJ07084.1 diphthine--ammonia ligase [Chitinophaga pendula]
MQSAFINWSSGKDACYALWQLQQSRQYDIGCLFTVLNATHQRISMHGVRAALLDRQAEQIGIPLKKAWLEEHAGMEAYDELMQCHLAELSAQGMQHAVFGDIFLEDLKRYRETQLAKIGMQGIFPLWQQNTTELVKRFVADGFKAIIVCVNAKHLDASFAGRVIDETFLRDLPPGVDPCGENGEFHSFVFDGPLFRQPVPFQLGETVERTYTPAPKDDNCYQEEETLNWDTRFFFKDLIEL